MKNLYTSSSYDRNERPQAFPFYQDYQQNTYFAPNQGTEANLMFDPKGVADPMNWSATPKFQAAPTEAQARTLTQIQSLAFANVLNNSLVTLGKDPSQGLYLRQLIGQAAMQPVQVADDEINETGIAREQTKLNDLMAQPEDRLKQKGMGDMITQSMSKLAYMKSRHNNTLVVPDTNVANYYRGQGVFGNIVGGIADMVITAWDTALNFNPANPAPFSPTEVPALQRMGGDGLRVLRSLGFNNPEVLADLEKETGSLPSTSTADMVALVESFDRKFDSKTWFNETIAADPTVRDGLLNYGVTEDLFKNSRNSTHALMTLMSKMNVSDIQRRLSNYVPTTYQSIYGFAASFKDGFLGSLDTAAEVALEIGGTIAVDTLVTAGLAAAPSGGTLAPVGGVGGFLLGLGEGGVLLYKTLSTAKKVVSSAWYLTGYGKLPRYAMQWGVIRTTGASALVGATSNSLIDYIGQKENIALANSLYFYNPDMQSVTSMEEVVGAAEAGALFGASLGMLGHVISTGLISRNNAKARADYIAHGMDPADAPQQRNPFQTTKDNIAAFRDRKVVAIPDPISGAIQTAVANGDVPTVVDINAAARTTSTAIDAASVTGSPFDAGSLPDHSLNRRQPNEPMKEFTIRAVLGKFVTSVTELLDADSAGGRFSLLTPREQYLTLLRSEDNMRIFADMTAFEENAVNKAAGKLIPTVTMDPLTGRADNAPANVAKLYSELDAHRSALDKTISKEDRAEAISAHKNGTELAPRTISGAVDKATSNARGIMENASEGRHNPSEAKGPKVDTEATTGVPTGENAAQGTTAPALPTQKKVDEITQDAAADMSLMTDEELADPKTRASIERNVTRQLFGGEKEHNLRSLSRGLAKARKLTLKQQARITAVLDNPRSFLKKAPGNPMYIKNFYDRLDLLVKMGNITDVDRRIILASTVNTSFSSNVAAKISDIGVRGDNRASTSLQGDIQIGKLDTSVEGNNRVENVLHEIGHVEELHAFGESLMDLRKLFTSEKEFIDAAQEVLGTDKFNKYYIAGNTQELMAQVKAKMMIDEVKLAVFLKTTNSTAVEKTLLNHVLRISTSLIEVFASLKLSKVDSEDKMYGAIKEILYKLETGAAPLMTRVNYQQRVTGALKEFPKGKLSPTDKAAFTKAINTKISEGFKKNDPALQDMMFTKDEVQSLHALTVHSDGSVDPIRLDAYLNVKREGITVKQKEKFIKTFQSYVEINRRYLASTTDIYIASMKENGYKAVPSNPIVMDASLSKRDQIAALREYHRDLAPDEMVVTPSYLDPTFGNFDGDLALRFLVDSSTEPTLMMAPSSTLAAPELMNVKVAEFAQKHFGNRKGYNGKLASENFIAWFGDSKVVDAEGNPLIVYHATRSNLFTTFKASVTGLYGKGNYFATLANVAVNFIKDGSRYVDNTTGLSVDVIADGGRVIPTFVSIKNPFITGTQPDFERVAMKALGLSLGDLADRAQTIYERGLPGEALGIRNPIRTVDDAYPAAITELLQEGGFDGIQVDFKKGDSYFIAFDSSQSKSSIANSGDFGTNEPNIMFAPQTRPQVTKWAQDKFGDRKAPDGSLVSENFARWFGDSELVDAEGNPQLVYHGTRNKFTQFMEQDATRLSYFSSEFSFSKRWAESKMGEEVFNPTPAEQKLIAEVNFKSSETTRLAFEKLSKQGVLSNMSAAELKDVQDLGTEVERSLLNGETLREFKYKISERGLYSPAVVLGVYIKADNIFNPTTMWQEFMPKFEEVLQRKRDRQIANGDFEGRTDPLISEQTLEDIKSGTYYMWEMPEIVNAVFKKYDAIRLHEPTSPAAFAKKPLSTIAIRDSWRVKSATDNDGSFGANSPDIMFAPRAKPSVAFTPELVVQRLAFLSTNLKDNPANAADFKTAMQGMFGMNDELFDALSKVKGEVKPDQMAEYHQAVIRRIVDALMAEKLAVGPEGIRRLNAVEREMNPVRASKQIAKTKEATIERARYEPVDNMPEDATDSKLYPNNPMNATMLENFWNDGVAGKQVLARLKSQGIDITDGTVFTSLADKMTLIEAKGIDILTDAKTGERRSRNALINYIALAVQRNVFDEKSTVSRAGLTPASWSEFLATENDIIRTSRDGGAEITFDGTPMQHMAAEKKKDSELYQRFKKAYSKSSMVVDAEGIRASATATKTSEAKVSQVKAEGLGIMVDYATSLEYNIFSTKDRGWQKFVITNLIEGKSYAEIATLANENGFKNKKANNVTDAVDAVRARFKTMLSEEMGTDLTGMTDDQVQATGVLEAVKEKVDAANAKRETAPVEDLDPERKSSAEILAETEKSTTEQANSDELTNNLSTTEPTSQPVISPENSKGPVTAVVQVDDEPVGPLTPHVEPKVAEGVAKNPKNPKARFTSSTPKKLVNFTTGDSRAMLKATGNVGKLFFASMKTMEGLLNALPKAALKDTDIGSTIKILKKMVAAGEEKEAIAKFLALMKHLDIEAVKIIDPKDGRTVMNFIFAEQSWSYGGISRFTAKPKIKKEVRTKAEPRTTKQKEIDVLIEAGRNEVQNKPQVIATEPTTATPTEAAPDGTQVPVMEPKEVPSDTLAGGSVVPVISEHDRIVTGLTEGNDALRDGGVDATSFTALFKKYVRSLSKDAKKKLGTELPEGFKDVFMKFVELNAAIMHDNRALFGDHKIVDRFWKQVDIMLAVEDGLQMKDQMRVRLTMKEIYAMAAAHVSTKQLRFLPPLTHENITIKNGKFGLRNVSKETQGVLARRDTGPIVAYTPEELAARKAAAATDAPAGPIGPVTPAAKPKGPLTVKEILDKDFNKEGDPTVAAEAEIVLDNSARIDTIMGKIKTSFNQLLRQNNFVSWLLGGSERANRNRWRTWMSNSVNALQHASKLGLTIRAMNDEVRFMAMFMEDSRAMTGQLVAPNGTPIRSAAKSKQEAVMFTANLTRIHHALEAEAQVLKLDPMSRKLLQKMQIVAWQKKTSPTAQEMSLGFGGGDFTKMAVIMENYRKEMLHLNTEMLKLEEKTGWRTVTKNGKPIEADSYLPIQLHMQKLMAAMGDNQQYDNLTRSIVATRRANKMADDRLDRNTLITMGIMNLEDNSKFYTQDRTFALAHNTTLDADTLKKLKKYTTTTSESKDFTKTLGEEGRDFFIIQEGGNKATVYMMPTETKHLSDADLKKYYDTVSGDQTHVTKAWKEEFDNKGLIEVEMKELLDFKSRQGRYHHTKNFMVNDRPVLDGNHHDEAFSTVRNFSIEELISDAELFKVARTDLHAAYQNFSRYRMFDLLFQESLDQLSGSTGLRPKEFFRLMEERIKQKADMVSKGMPQDQRAAMIKDIEDGMGRLVWQYAEYNGTITRSGSESRVGQNIARTVRGLATTSSGLGYGLSQSPELAMEILKNMPQTKGISVPKGLFTYITSLLKVWDRKDSATRYQVGDLITSMEEYSKDHSTHFNEGIADIDFDTDMNAPYRAIWNSGRNSEGMTGQVADFFQRTGQTAVLAGGVQDGTNHTRYYAKARHVRDLTTMMRDGKLAEFLRLRALPENRAAMQALLEGSFKSAAEERKLWKKHKELCRLANGLDPFNAFKAINVGLDTPLKLEAMVYGMNAANALDGVLDFRDLHMVYRDLKNMKNPPIKPELYRRAATDFQFGIEGLIRKRSGTHSFGLNQNLSVFNTQNEVGKLLNTLTTYMRSWFDDVALNAPERGAVGLMFGGVISVAVVETIISLLRDWMSGRELDDMIAELENDPAEYILKFVTRMPIFGVMTPVLEGLLKSAKYLSGGAQNGGQGFLDTMSQIGGGSPNIGVNSAMSMLKTTGEAGSDLVNGAIEGDTKLMAKGALRVPGHFFNKSIYAAPVRIMEEAMDLDDKHTAQFIIDGLQKKPYRYLSQQQGNRGARGGSTVSPQAPVSTPPMAQTIPESAALRNAQRPEIGRQVKEYVAPASSSKPNSGVSERLGKLLDNPSYTPTPPM